MSSMSEERFNRYYQPQPNARKAAVMLLLIQNDDGLHVAFIKRPVHPNDPHSGQISFPGGRMEDADDSYEACALRETYEEIGIGAERISVLGPLSKLYVFASNNLVYPYVGYLDHTPEFTLQKAEVDQVIMVPMRYFVSEAEILYKDLEVKGFHMKDVPYFDLRGHTLWGATAMIFIEWIQVWKRTFNT